MSKITIGDFDGEELKELLNYYYGNVFVIDGNGVLLYVNKSAAQSLGLTVEQLIGSTCYAGERLLRQKCGHGSP